MLPNLPTDNLYKLLALSGVALVLFGVWFERSLSDELYKDDEACIRCGAEIQDELEQGVLDVVMSDIEHFKSVHNELMEMPPEERAKRIGVAITDEELKSITRDFLEMRPFSYRPVASFSALKHYNYRDEFRNDLAFSDDSMLALSATIADKDNKATQWDAERIRKVREKIRECEVTAERIWAKKDQMAYRGTYLFFAGFAIASFGFWLWYHKLQRHQDRLINLQLSKAEKDLKSSNEKSQSS